MVRGDENRSCGPHSIGRLLGHIYKYTQRYMTSNLERYGITGQTFGFLFHLYHRDGLSEKEITSHMLVDKATTTRAISKLEEKGYVRRSRDPKDGRSYLVFLTVEAERIRPMMRDLRDQWNEIVLEGIDQDQRRTLLELLTTIEMNLQNRQEWEGQS